MLKKFLLAYPIDHFVVIGLDTVLFGVVQNQQAVPGLAFEVDIGANLVKSIAVHNPGLVIDGFIAGQIILDGDIFTADAPDGRGAFLVVVAQHQPRNGK